MATKWCTNIEVALKSCLIIFQGRPSNLKVTQLKKIVDLEPNWVFPDCNSSLNSPLAMKWCTKLEVVWKSCQIFFQKLSVKFQHHLGQKITDFGPNWAFLDSLKVQFEITDGFEAMYKPWRSVEKMRYYFWKSTVKFQSNMGWKLTIWIILGWSQLLNPSYLPCFHHGRFSTFSTEIDIYSFLLTQKGVAVDSWVIHRW